MCGLFENGFFVTILIYLILSYFLHQNIAEVGTTEITKGPKTEDKKAGIMKIFRDETHYTPLGQKIKFARNMTTVLFIVFLALTTVCPT